PSDSLIHGNFKSFHRLTSPKAGRDQSSMLTPQENSPTQITQVNKNCSELNVMATMTTKLVIDRVAAKMFLMVSLLISESLLLK
ncbi:MAG: hypothetical protein IJ709_09050, partial [Selenomonas sp.]|nr:hypothetical protein [Selenomonas sp.]